MTDCGTMTSKRGVEEGGVDDLMFRANLWQRGAAQEAGLGLGGTWFADDSAWGQQD